MGTIQSGALEESNVDLSSEFANLIQTQRAFQANARIITTSDEMLQDLVDMKH
jgi:flagellar hook protein FlgE